MELGYEERHWSLPPAHQNPDVAHRERWWSTLMSQDSNIQGWTHTPLPVWSELLALSVCVAADLPWVWIAVNGDFKPLHPLNSLNTHGCVQGAPGQLGALCAWIDFPVPTTHSLVTKTNDEMSNCKGMYSNLPVNHPLLFARVTYERQVSRVPRTPVLFSQTRTCGLGLF